MAFNPRIIDQSNRDFRSSQAVGGGITDLIRLLEQRSSQTVQNEQQTGLLNLTQQFQAGQGDKNRALTSQLAGERLDAQNELSTARELGATTRQNIGIGAAKDAAGVAQQGQFNLEAMRTASAQGAAFDRAGVQTTRDLAQDARRDFEFGRDVEEQKRREGVAGGLKKTSAVIRKSEVAQRRADVLRRQADSMEADGVPLEFIEKMRANADNIEASGRPVVSGPAAPNSAVIRKQFRSKFGPTLVRVQKSIGRSGATPGAAVMKFVNEKLLRDDPGALLPDAGSKAITERGKFVRKFVLRPIIAAALDNDGVVTPEQREKIVEGFLASSRDVDTLRAMFPELIGNFSEKARKEFIGEKILFEQEKVLFSESFARTIVEVLSDQVQELE